MIATDRSYDALSLFLALFLWTEVRSMTRKLLPVNIFYSFFVRIFPFQAPNKIILPGECFLVLRVSGTVCSEKHLQTIIGKCVKPAINLFYWCGSLSGSLRRIDFSPCERETEKAKLLKRTSQTEADAKRRKWQGENGEVETEPELLQQSPWWKQKLLEVFKCKAGYHRSSSQTGTFRK